METKNKLVTAIHEQYQNNTEGIDLLQKKQLNRKIEALKEYELCLSKTDTRDQRQKNQGNENLCGWVHLI